MQSQKEKIFAEYYCSQEEAKLPLSKTGAAQHDTDKRQAPLKVFKKIGRNDYSYKKQISRVYDFGIKGEQAKALSDRINEVNEAYW